MPESPVFAMPTAVRRRDGATAAFDAGRITRALARAGAATGAFGTDEAERLTRQALRLIAHRHAGDTPSVEAIQDLAETVLIAAGHVDTARAFIAYRAQHHRLRADRRTLVDVAQSMNEYLDRLDWRINANANQRYSLGGLILNTAGKVTANYWLSHVYPEAIGQAHRDGDFHIHDLDMLAGYCAGWSLRSLLAEGFNGVGGNVDCAPPHRLSSALGQMVNFLGTLQNEWAGAQAFSSVDTFLAPYVRNDRLDLAKVRQHMQQFVFGLNIPSRWGTQTPFTNLSFDWTCPADLADQVPVIAGQEMPFTYGDLQPEMDLINRAFLEVMGEGDATGRTFTFPIPTYNITRDFPWDSDNARRLFELAGRFGTPYFQNFINSDLKPGQVRSMCCRLQLDLRQLAMRGGGLFGAGDQTGSIGVVTLNCARLGHTHAGDRPGLFAAVDRLLDLARDSLEIKRKVLKGWLDAGLYPYTQRYLGTYRHHFSTIGVNGVNEMVRNFTADAHDLTTPTGQTLARDLLDHVRARLVAFQEQTGHLYNLEGTPAEGAAYRFAKSDTARFPGILHAGPADSPYYTNSTQLPVQATDDPFAALDLQDDLQTRYNGGTVFHLYVGEPIDDPALAARLVQRIFTRHRLPYLTLSPTFSVCPAHGYIPGEYPTCPNCGATAEVFKRVMGYYRPTSQYNRGKAAEHAERVPFRAKE